MRKSQFFVALLLPLLTVSMSCRPGGREKEVSTAVAAQSDTVAVVVAAEPESLVVEPPIEDAEPVIIDWSIEQRALAFREELIALQEAYDHAVHHLAIGDLLQSQEAIEEVNAMLGAALADSGLATGLSRLYLGSLRTRLDRLQEILDEESLMQFAAPLDVANDSLIALWYGGLPEEPARPLTVIRNAGVDKWLNSFSGPGRKSFQQWLDRGSTLKPFIEETLARHDLPPELFFMAMIESGFDSSALSTAGAVGPWQFIRGTGRRYGLVIDYWTDERRDIVRSTEAACSHLSHLYGIFQDWYLAMAAYNSGEFRVQAAVRRAGSRDFWRLKLPRETRDYVPKMIAATIIGKDPVKWGFSLPAKQPFRYEDLKIDGAVDLSLIAKKGGFSVSKLKRLNPHLLRWCTPPDRSRYSVHLPVGKSSIVGTALAALSARDRVSFRRHRVKRGETLYEIARGYGTSVKAIQKRNGIVNPKSLRAGTVLIVPTHPDKPFRDTRNGSVTSAAEKALPPIKVPRGKVRAFYTVRRGDTLSGISRRLGVSVRQLQSWNKLRSTRINANQVLQFLRSDNEDGRFRKATHIVRRGETLWSISRHYNTRVAKVLEWNPHLTRDSVLHPGDRIVIYKKN